MPQKNWFFIALLLSAVVGIAIGSIGFYFSAEKQIAHKSDTSGNQITPSITPAQKVEPYIVSGRVEKIENGNISLVFLSAVQKDIDISTRSATLATKNTAYIVHLSPSIRYTRQSSIIPYVFTPPLSPTEIPITSDTIKIGMIINITTPSDLTEKELIAQEIHLPRITYVLDSTIKTITANQLTVDAIPIYETLLDPSSPGYTPVTHEIYTIHITEQTEISKQLDKNSKKFVLTDLNVGQKIIIYATSDVTESHTVTAGRIEPSD